MARKKAPKKKAPKATAGGRSKKEIKEIKVFLEEEGWKATISEYKVSPRELSAIRDGKTYVPAKRKKTSAKKAPRKKAGAKKSTRKKTSKKKAPRRKAPRRKAAAKKRSTKKTNDAPWGYKADGTPRKRPGPSKKKSSKKAPAKKAPRKKSSKKKAVKKKATIRKAPSSMDDGKVLDWLLAYRNSNIQGPLLTLDQAIIDLTTRVRGAA